MRSHSSVLFVISFLIFYIGIAQETDKDNDLDTSTFKSLYSNLEQLNSKTLDTTIKTNWITRGEITSLFNQTNFKNWVSGGQNSLSANLSFKYFITYNKERYTLDSRIWFAYGFTSIENNNFDKKTEDIIEFNSVFGIKIGKYTYGSIFGNFKSQFTKGYSYSKKNNIEIRTENSSFLSPGDIKLGVGMLLKRTDFIKFNFSPFTGKLILVDKKYTLPKNKYYGVKEGDDYRIELGANLESYLKFKLIENVYAEQIVNFYANYLEQFGDIDIIYTLSITMKINKILSSNFRFDALYNENAFQGFQLKELIGLGIYYNF